MTIYINGEIVDTLAEKTTPEDFCPQDLRDMLADL